MIASIQDLRKYVTQLSTGIVYADIEPDVKSATRIYIEPYLGSSFPNTAPLAIKNLIDEAIANFTAYRYSLKNAIQLTASGMQSVSNANFQPSAKYDKFNFRDMVLATGYNALESALYLAIRETDFKNTPQCKKATARLLNFTFEITSYNLDFETFQPIKKHIQLVEKQLLKPLLGDALYNDLLIKQYTVDLNELKTELLNTVRDALGQYAIELAFEQNLLNIVGQQVSIKTLLNDDAKHQTIAPPIDLYTLAMQTKADYSARYFYALNDFLTQNADALNWSAPVTVLTASENTVEQVGIKTLG